MWTPQYILFFIYFIYLFFHFFSQFGGTITQSKLSMLPPQEGPGLPHHMAPPIHVQPIVASFYDGWITNTLRRKHVKPDLIRIWYICVEQHDIRIDVKRERHLPPWDRIVLSRTPRLLMVGSMIGIQARHLGIIVTAP